MFKFISIPNDFEFSKNKKKQFIIKMKHAKISAKKLELEAYLENEKHKVQLEGKR